MELYYKNLISEEASLEKLVDDLMLVVQGADEFARETGGGLEGAKREEVVTRLRRLKEACQRVREQAVSGATATDKLLHEHPYSFVGAAFAAGLLLGALIFRSRGD